MIFLSSQIYSDIHSSNIYGKEYIPIFLCQKNHIRPTLAYLQSILVEEISMKLMDRPSVKEMDKEGVFEIDRQTKCQKK